MRRLIKAFGSLSSLAVLGGAGAFFGGYWLVRYLRPRFSPLVLNGAVVIVTGASSGIGRAYAEAFARRGAKLVLVARRGDLLESLRKEIEPYAAEVLVIAADLADEDARQAVITQTIARFGRVSVLINNAGQLINGPLETYDPAKMEQVVTVNLTAAMSLTRHALPAMLTRGRGVIINVSSIAGRAFGTGYSVYSATKSGLLAFGEVIRRDVHGTGVQVISVLPGYVRTEMVAADGMTAQFLRDGGSLIEPSEVAEATIKALLNNQNEVLIASPLLRMAAYLDRRYPNLTTLIMQTMNSPERIHASRGDKER